MLPLWLFKNNFFFIPFKGPSQALAHTQTYLAGQSARADQANDFTLKKKKKHH